MQTNIKMYIFLSSFAITLCTVTDAWLTKYDFNGDYGDHKWNSQVSPPVSTFFYSYSYSDYH